MVKINQPSPADSLKWLVKWALDNRHCPTAGHIRAILRSIYDRSHTCSVGAIAYMEDRISSHLMNVIDATVGRRPAGALYDANIRDAFRAAGGENWFFESEPKKD